MTIDLSTLKPGDTMTKFEDELREAVKYAKSKYWLCELTNDEIEPLYKAAALLLDILPELRGVVWRTIESAPRDGGCIFAKWENENGTFYGRIYWDDHFENWSDGYYPLSISKVTHWMRLPTHTLTEKLKKAGVV